MIAARDDALSRFLTPALGESDRQRRLREGAGGLALHWTLTVRDSPGKTAALEMLADAMELICAAAGT